MGWKRATETKRRNKNLYEKTKYTYGAGCWYDADKERFIRYWTSTGRTGRVKFIKRKCNRAVRRYKGSLGNKGTYRKISEYWWEIW